MDKIEIQINSTFFIIDKNKLYTSTGIQRGCRPEYINSAQIEISEIRKQINKNQSFIECIVNYFKDKKNNT